MIIKSIVATGLLCAAVIAGGSGNAKADYWDWYYSKAACVSEGIDVTSDPGTPYTVWDCEYDNYNDVWDLNVY